MKKKTPREKRLIIKTALFMTLFFLPIFFLTGGCDDSDPEEKETYSQELSAFLRAEQLREKNKQLRSAKYSKEAEIIHLKDSIAFINEMIEGYTAYIPTAKASISVIETKKEKALTENNFDEYVFQDSLYMDSVAGLISLYDQTIGMHVSKSTAQDSVIQKYIEKEQITAEIFANEMTIVKSKHREEIDQLNKKLKRVKRQRNISLLGNVILATLVFWKK